MPYMMLRCQPKHRQDTWQMCNATPKGFEPLRAEPNGFLVHLLSHSDTVSCSKSFRFKAATRIAVLPACICCHLRSQHTPFQISLLPASGGAWIIICQHRATCAAVPLQTRCNINKAGGGRRAQGRGAGCLSIVMRPSPQAESKNDASTRL